MNFEQLQANLKHPQLCVKPLFVIGAPRSGTHGLAYSLARHSHLWTHGETEILMLLFGDLPVQDVFQALRQRKLPTWAGMYNVDHEEFLAYLGIGINALFTSRNPGKRWIDKTPKYVLIGELLAAMFPDALFLHMLRDGRRVVHSMTHFLDRFTAQQRQGMIESGMVSPFHTDFRAACQHWRRFAKTGLTFAAKYPQRVLTVVNEALVADPANEFRKVFEFIGEPFEEMPVMFFQNFRILSSFSQNAGEETAVPDFSKPLSEWSMDDAKFFLEPVPYKDTQPWTEWTGEQKQIFAEEAGALMVECGFASGDEMSSWGALAPVKEGKQAVLRALQAVGSKAQPSLVAQDISDVAAVVLPREATVLVVSQGDDRLLGLKAQNAWHFPRDLDGDYDAETAAKADAALEQIEALREKGAAYLLVPQTAFDWLEQNTDFRDGLERRFDRYWKDARCVIFRISQPLPGSGPARPLNHAREGGSRATASKAAVARDEPGEPGTGPGYAATALATSPEGLATSPEEMNERGRHIQEMEKVIWYLKARWPTAFSQLVGGASGFMNANWESLRPRQLENRVRATHDTWTKVAERWVSYARELAAEATAAPEVPEADRPHSAYPYDVSRLASLPDVKPVFVLGAPRSGTTAMAAALRHGADLFGWVEGHAFSRLPVLLAANMRTWVEHLRFNKPEQNQACALGNVDIYQVLNQVVRVYDQLYANATAAVGKRRWLDKTPTVDGLAAVPLLSHLYPNARFIFMHRHPIKRALSRQKRRSSAAMSVEATAMNWVLAMTAWTEFKKILKPGSFLEVPQPYLSVFTDAVVDELTRLLDLTEQQTKGVRDYLQTQRPESTRSSDDTHELSLDRVDWSPVVKRWFQEALEPTARAWGYRLTNG